MSSELLLQQVLAADGMMQRQPPVRVPWLAQLEPGRRPGTALSTETLYKFVVDRVTEACDKVGGDGAIRIKGDGVAGELTSGSRTASTRRRTRRSPRSGRRARRGCAAVGEPQGAERDVVAQAAR